MSAGAQQAAPDTAVTVDDGTHRQTVLALALAGIGGPLKARGTAGKYGVRARAQRMADQPGLR
jgi:hypothetical protein